MPSPFPATDPYIEAPQVWSDFHPDLAGQIRASLNQVIQPRYVARLSPYVTYEVVEIGAGHAMRPDISIERSGPPAASPGTATATLVPTAVESLIPLEVPLRLYRVEIQLTETGQLVTVIEILSPVNKRPSHDAFAEYARKRRDILRSYVHLIEIDLLRGGTRPPLAAPVPAAPYYVVLSRAERRPKVDVWPVRLQDPLPVVPVPLVAPDADVDLDLGAAVASVYERGGYTTLIDYSQPTPPPVLSAEDAGWISGLLREGSYSSGET